MRKEWWFIMLDKTWIKFNSYTRGVVGKAQQLEACIRPDGTVYLRIKVNGIILDGELSPMEDWRKNLKDDDGAFVFGNTDEEEE